MLAFVKSEEEEVQQARDALRSAGSTASLWRGSVLLERHLLARTATVPSTASQFIRDKAEASYFSINTLVFGV